MGSSEPYQDPSDAAATDRESISLLDVAVGVSTLAASTAGSVAGRTVRVVARPFAGVVLRLPMPPPRFQTNSWLIKVARRGDERRDELKHELSAVLDSVLPTVVGALMQRIDLTGTIKRYVDLDSIITEVDLDALMDRLDLVGLAEGVIAEVNLPEIIRESTGSLASETVRGVRMQGISGDEALGRAVGRLRLRRNRRAAATPSTGVDTSPPVAPDGVPHQPRAEATTMQP